MKKKLVCFTMTAALAMTAAVPAMAAGVTATPNNASVAVDGEGIAIGAYNIGGYNYFKLRDIAAALNGTGANFEVGYDAAAKAIALTTGAVYSETGNELKDSAPTAKKTATVSDQKIILDGREVSMQAYLIDGYNYFQLRELGENLGFDVTWDGAAKAINMVTYSGSYVEEFTGGYGGPGDDEFVGGYGGPGDDWVEEITEPYTFEFCDEETIYPYETRRITTDEGFSGDFTVYMVPAGTEYRVTTYQNNVLFDLVYLKEVGSGPYWPVGMGSLSGNDTWVARENRLDAGESYTFALNEAGMWKINALDSNNNAMYYFFEVQD